MERELFKNDLKILSKILLNNGKKYANNKLNYELNLTTVENYVCKLFNISTFDLNKDSRKRPIVWARMFMYVYMVNGLNFTLQKTGNRFNKDHSTVLCALNKHDELLKTDKNVFGDNLYTTYFENFCWSLELDIKELKRYKRYGKK